ncbi:30S ribosomal protein S8, putative [Ricinus communis]|uniref:30S ribosomal protein S8, putative n=1 Tax=Ricinus communis TaxID=3988 RepID=B9RRQ1_RICCO|nr:30S ribosomal protein S8, putative [Ricinus communis]
MKFLLVMQKHGYIGVFEYIDDLNAGKIVVELNGRLNKCGVIIPHFDVGVKEIEESRLLDCSHQDSLIMKKLEEGKWVSKCLGSFTKADLF